MNIISINNTQLTEQPSGLNESWKKVYTEQTSLSGNVQRTQYPSRKLAVLTWQFATPALVAYFKALEDAGAAVTYKNDYSPIYQAATTFSGVLTANAGEYQRGGSGLMQLTVTIQEGEAYSV